MSKKKIEQKKSEAKTAAVQTLNCNNCVFTMFFFNRFTCSWACGACPEQGPEQKTGSLEQGPRKKQLDTEPVSGKKNWALGFVSGRWGFQLTSGQGQPLRRATVPKKNQEKYGKTLGEIFGISKFQRSITKKNRNIGESNKWLKHSTRAKPHMSSYDLI